MPVDAIRLRRSVVGLVGFVDLVLKLAVDPDQFLVDRLKFFLAVSSSSVVERSSSLIDCNSSFDAFSSSFERFDCSTVVAQLVLRAMQFLFELDEHRIALGAGCAPPCVAFGGVSSSVSSNMTSTTSVPEELSRNGRTEISTRYAVSPRMKRTRSASALPPRSAACASAARSSIRRSGCTSLSRLYDARRRHSAGTAHVVGRVQDFACAVDDDARRRMMFERALMQPRKRQAARMARRVRLPRTVGRSRRAACPRAARARCARTSSRSRAR